jgi:serine phosphatase RsbU (regulator of sigma subunit)/CHASE3 domain sensor protein
MRLSLRWKIVGGFGLLLALMALLGWVTLSLFGSLRSVQRRVFDEAIPGVVTVDEIVRSYTAQLAAVRGYLINPSEPRLLEQYETEVGMAEFWQDEAESLFTSGREREFLDDLTAAGRRFQQLVDDEVIPRAQEGDRAQAFRILSVEGAPAISEIEFFSQQLREAQDQTVVAAEANVRDRSRQAIALLLVVLIGALAIGLAVAIALPRRLVSNLSRLVDAARGVGRGELNQRLDIRSRDEVEELATRFNEMQSGLKRLQQLALQERELDIAASIQRKLLQRTMPSVPGLRIVPHQRQANLVGGDWYDVELAGDQLIVVVGDASGKGIGAALMATVALSFLRSERGLGSDAKRVVARANDALREATDPDSFTTLVYATVDPVAGEVRWLNMGHPSPFVLRGSAPEGTEPRGYFLEGPRNRALGWFEEPGLAENVTYLAPGDRLVLFTDGWLEAKSPAGEVFGEHRFADALLRFASLAADRVGEEVVGEVEAFAAGKLDDDLTMLIVELEGAPGEAGLRGRTGEEPWHSRR